MKKIKYFDNEDDLDSFFKVEDYSENNFKNMGTTQFIWKIETINNLRNYNKKNGNLLNKSMAISHIENKRYNFLKDKKLWSNDKLEKYFQRKMIKKYPEITKKHNNKSINDLKIASQKFDPYKGDLLILRYESKANSKILTGYFDILSYSSFRTTNISYQKIYDRKRIELIRKTNLLNNKEMNHGLPNTYEENDKFLELVKKGYGINSIKQFFRRSDSSIKSRLVAALSGTLQNFNSSLASKDILQNPNYSAEGKIRLKNNLDKLENIKRHKGYITPIDIRTQCMVRHQIQNQIDRGRKPLITLEECEEYWWTYSKFITQQWSYVFKEFEKIIRLPSDKAIQIIDYGSGQSLASLILLDKFFRNDKTQILDITLIDKSSLALGLARKFLGIHSPELGSTRLITINEEVDNTLPEFLETNSKALKIHLFSNILDMGVIDPDQLLSKINKNRGKHLFLAVSQGSDYAKGSVKFKDFYEQLWLSKYKFKPIGDKFQIAPKQFTIETTEKEMNVIFFVAYAEVVS